MREGLFLGLVLLGCGGAAAKADFGPSDGGSSGSSISDGGSQAAHGGTTSTPEGGSGADSGSAGATAGQGGASVAGAGGSHASAGSGGKATAGSGGSSGAAAGDAGSGGEGGGSAPDDTGCVERPWTGNVADLSEKVPGLDCSSCTTGDELGYTAPAFCADAKTCQGAVDVAALPKDVYLLLPPGSAQKGFCKEQNCEGSDGNPADLEGFTLQLLLNLTAGHTIKVETDDQRRVILRDLPLTECSEASSCLAFGSAAKLAIVVKPGAPRGWARISVDSGDACH